VWREVTEPFISERGMNLEGLFVDAKGELVVWGDESLEEGDTVDNVPTFWATADLVGWRKTRLGAVGESLVLVDVAEGPRGFVSVGFALDTIAAWSSADGQSWSRGTIEPPGVRERAGFTAVSGGANGYLAVGSDFGRAAAWLSSTGQNWTKVDVDFPAGEFWDVARSLDGGFVVVGEDRSEGDWDAMAWVVSSDGAGWRPAESNEATAGPGDDDITRIWSFAGGYVAFGHEIDPPERPCGPCRDVRESWRLYTSPDGIEWARDEIDFATAPGEPVLTEYDAIEPWAGGLVTVGRGTDSQLHTWLSADGIAWRPVGEPVRLSPEARRSVSDLLVFESYLVIAGSGRDEYVALASAR
jgi:hypothetical protein